ncbi:MAG TPA: nuclear transport factor 2 family protein [Gemmata sp.]
MSDQPSPDVELLRAAYAAFNARDIAAALATMAPDVIWPKAFKGGFACGHQEVRTYWTEQWSEIDPRVEPITFHPEGAGRTLVEVHQVVQDRAGAVVADGRVGHRFTIESGLIRTMEVCPLPVTEGEPGFGSSPAGPAP